MGKEETKSAIKEDFNGKTKNKVRLNVKIEGKDLINVDSIEIKCKKPPILRFIDMKLGSKTLKTEKKHRKNTLGE